MTRNAVPEGVFEISGQQYLRKFNKRFMFRARLDFRKYSFPQQVVNNLNDLPEWVVTADSVVTFEARLDKYWNNKD